MKKIYFNWPEILDTDEDGVRTRYFESFAYVGYTLQKTLQAKFGALERVWHTLEDDSVIILKSDLVQIGLDSDGGVGIVWIESLSPRAETFVKDNWYELTNLTAIQNNKYERRNATQD